MSRHLVAAHPSRRRFATSFTGELIDLFRRDETTRGRPRRRRLDRRENSSLEPATIEHRDLIRFERGSVDPWAFGPGIGLSDRRY